MNNTAFNEALFVSEPRKIGNTYWTICVYPSRFVGCVCTGFSWSTDSKNWKKDENHPRYNHNDGEFAGLPKGLVSLFNDNRVSIEAHLPKAFQ